MARTGSYKTYERNTRNYTLENTFTGGMKYSNAPISEGEVRILNNFDLSNDRMTLQPRKGLRLDTTVMPNAFEINDDRVKLKYFNSLYTLKIEEPILNAYNKLECQLLTPEDVSLPKA